MSTSLANLVASSSFQVGGLNVNPNSFLESPLLRSVAIGVLLAGAGTTIWTLSMSVPGLKEILGFITYRTGIAGLADVADFMEFAKTLPFINKLPIDLGKVADVIQSAVGFAKLWEKIRGSR
jgi:hypothetical protein